MSDRVTGGPSTHPNAVTGGLAAVGSVPDKGAPGPNGYGYACPYHTGSFPRGAPSARVVRGVLLKGEIGKGGVIFELSPVSS